MTNKVLTALVSAIKVMFDIFVAVTIWLSCEANWVAFIAVFYIAIFWVTQDIRVFIPEKTMTIIDVPSEVQHIEERKEEKK